MKTIKYPPSIQWEVTSFCNHDCIHCYNYWRSNDTKKEDIKFNNRVDENYYLKIAKKLVEAKPVRVTITGGEPLSIFDKIKSSIKLLISNNIVVTINTNIVLLNDEIANFLQENDIKLFVSLPSANEKICDEITNVKNSLEKIYRGIKLAQKYGISVNTNMVISKLNYHTIYETALFVKEKLNSNYFCVTKASLPINAKEDFANKILSLDEINMMFEELIKIKNELNMNIDSSTVYCLCGLDNENIINELYSKRFCNAGRTTFAMTSNGDIKACARDDKIYGNIMNDSFEEVIEKMEEWQNGSLFPIECKNCKSISICGTGCRLDAKSTTGCLNKLDYTCNLDNLNRTLTIKKPTLNQDMILSLNPETIIVQENNFVRLSHKAGFNYVSDEFYKFISENKLFTINDIISNFNIPLQIINDQIYNLIKLGILLKEVK